MINQPSPLVHVSRILIAGVHNKTPGEKIKRDAFLYMSGKDKEFAQCGTCWQFNAEKERCAILGPDFKVDDDDSCCLYVQGTPVKNQPIVARITPKAAGFVERPVRCENCRYSKKSDGGSECLLFKMLNEKFPDCFDLEISISSKSCCNAQTPR